MTRRTYRNAEPTPGTTSPGAEAPPPSAPPPPPAEGIGTKAWGVGKSLLLAAATAVAAVIAVDFYRKVKSKRDEDELTPNPALASSPGMMPQFFMGGGGTQIVPLPLPWPMPGMPMMPQPAQVLEQTRNKSELSATEALEMQRLKTEEAKAKALNAQIEAWMEGED